jgi:hypothetical protein
MQILNAAPRDMYSAATIAALLVADRITYSAGLEILDVDNNVTSDISDDLLSGEISRINSALIPGTCKLVVTRELLWGKDRVRPYMTLSDGTTTARFNLGVFVLTTPDSVQGEDPVSYDVFGYELLYLLQSSVADTYVITAGTTYLSAVSDLVAAADIGGTVQLDGTLSSSTLLLDMVWALDPTSSTSWLDIINSLLASINYQKLWADENGVFRSAPYIAPIDRAVEWTFDTSNDSTNIVGPNRKLTSDVWGASNWWRFVRKGMTTKPVEGDGIYTVENVSTGRTSQTAMGRIIRAKVQFLDASNQTSLVAQGDRIVSTNQAVSRTFQISVDPLPIAGHFDIVQLSDAGASDKCKVTNWVLPLDGSQGTWTLEATSG